MAGSDRPIRYLSPAQAKALHVALMRDLGEAYYGLADEGLLDSALWRAQNAALYAGAGFPRQAADILWGVLRNHPFLNGNKRTACHLAFVFLALNGCRVAAPKDEVVRLAYAVDQTAGALSVDHVEEWLRRHTGCRPDRSR
ncbi:MAG: type II toxin-antitoxin system death-on-curing family toxin [Acidobacteria bacterium]|nr:type II toxin-antitoxin system death-on-curing family toxin [Acidobacteriota bacterium]